MISRRAYWCETVLVIGAAAAGGDDGAAGWHGAGYFVMILHSSHATQRCRGGLCAVNAPTMVAIPYLSWHTNYLNRAKRNEKKADLVYLLGQSECNASFNEYNLNCAMATRSLENVLCEWWSNHLYASGNNEISSPIRIQHICLYNVLQIESLTFRRMCPGGGVHALHTTRHIIMRTQGLGECDQLAFCDCCWHNENDKSLHWLKSVWPPRGNRDEHSITDSITNR